MTIDVAPVDKVWVEPLNDPTNPFEHYERLFCAIVAVVGKPETYLDVYSSSAWLVRMARVMGCGKFTGFVPTKGRMREARPYASLKVVPDLAVGAFITTQKYELVTCIGYRMPTRTFIQNICSLVADGGHLVCSSYGSVDTRIEQVQAEGLCYAYELTEQLQCAISGIEGTVFWLPEKTLVFTR